GARAWVFSCSGGFLRGATLTCATASGADVSIQTNNKGRRKVVARIAMIPPTLTNRSPQNRRKPKLRTYTLHPIPPFSYWISKNLPSVYAPASSGQSSARFVMLRAILELGLGAGGHEELSLFDELRDIQATYGYLPADQLHKLSKRLEKPVSELHAVASFYPHFYLKPPPKADVRVCGDMSCHLCGASQLRQGLENVFAGRAPTEITIRDVSCLGRCDTAPAISVNDQIYSGIRSQFAIEIIQAAIGGKLPRPSSKEHPRPQLETDPYQGRSSYKAVQQFVKNRNFAAVLNTLKTSTLRGMGGAGFPTGSKWEIVRNAPGTIKDRYIMENVPHLVIEGVIVAGLVTGATKGFIYIRHEYEEPREVLQQEIRRCYREGILGQSILGTNLNFDLEIFVS